MGLVGIGALAMPDRAWALKYYPTTSEKKWAVLYGTWCGAARDAGVWISEGMGGIADVFDVRENADLRIFDHLIIGSAIRWSKATTELEQYLENNRSWIKEKVRGLYTVCGNMQKPITPEVVKTRITVVDLTDIAAAHMRIMLFEKWGRMSAQKGRPRQPCRPNGHYFSHSIHQQRI